METEKALGMVAFGWLVGAFVLMSRSIQTGRELAEALATRHPETYEVLGRPRPGYFQSVRRDRFSRFVARREYEDLSDPPLAAEFDAYRKAEARLVVSLLATMAILGAFVFAASRA